MTSRKVGRRVEARKSVTRVAPSEHQEQSALIQWWGYQCKRFGIAEKLLYAIPNGGFRHPAIAGKLKAEGVRSGVPDLMLCAARAGHHGLYVEMKAIAKYPTPDQKDYHELLREAGYRVEVCRGAAEAQSTITSYLEGA